MESKELSNILNLQKVLINTDLSNLKETCNYIIASDFVKYTHGIKLLTNEIKKIIFLRPSKIRTYSTLVKSIYDLRGEGNFLSLIPHFIEDYQQLSVSYRFVRECIINGVLDIEDLIHRISGPLTEDNIFTFFFFADLIKIYNEEEYSRFQFIIVSSKTSGTVNFNSSMRTCLIERIVKNFPKYEENDFQLLRPLITFGWPSDSLQFHMILDDIDFMTSYAQDNILDVDLVQQFDATDKNKFAIPFTENTSLVEFCAFYGAVKCVKFLLDKNAKLRKNSMKYAFAGGNREIISMFEKAGADIESGIFCSIMFRWNDIFFEMNSRIEQRQSYINKVFSVAVQSNNLEILLHYLNKPVYFNSNNIPETVIDFDSIDLIKIFYTKGCNFRSLACTMAAAKNGNVEILKFLIENHAEINGSVEKNAVPLIAAVESHNYEAVELLLKNGADPNMFDKVQAPLHAACLYPYSDIVELLILNGAYVNVSNKKKELPIIIAARKGYTHIIELLIKFGAEYDSISSIESPSPLFIAARSGHLETVKYLVSVGCNPNEAIQPEALPFNGAHRARRTDVAKYLSETVTNITYVRVLQLFSAVKQKDLDSIYKLVQKGTPLNERDALKRSAMHYAATTNREVITLLRRSGADPNLCDFDEMTPLHIAVLKDNLECIRALVENGANINLLNSKGYSVLRIAAQNGNFEVIEYLLSEGADPNIEDFEDMTPLISIAGHKRTEERIALMALFLNNGADPRMVEKRGFSALRIILRNDPTIEEIDLLVKNHSPINGQTRKGIQAIVDAAHLEPTLFQFFVSIGADIKLTSKNGDTALHGAAETEYIENAQFLIDMGLSPNIKNKRQRTPIFNAVWRGTAPMVDFLISKGANINALDEDGSNALICALKSDSPPSLSFVKFLVSRKMNVKKINKLKESAKSIAKGLGFTQIAEYISSL